MACCCFATLRGAAFFVASVHVYNGLGHLLSFIVYPVLHTAMTDGKDSPAFIAFFPGMVYALFYFLLGCTIFRGIENQSASTIKWPALGFALIEVIFFIMKIIVKIIPTETPTVDDINLEEQENFKWDKQMYRTLNYFMFTIVGGIVYLCVLFLYVHQLGSGDEEFAKRFAIPLPTSLSATLKNNSRDPHGTTSSSSNLNRATNLSNPSHNNNTTNPSTLNPLGSSLAFLKRGGSFTKKESLSLLANSILNLGRPTRSTQSSFRSFRYDRATNLNPEENPQNPPPISANRPYVPQKNQPQAHPSQPPSSNWIMETNFTQQLAQTNDPISSPHNLMSGPAMPVEPLQVQTSQLPMSMGPHSSGPAHRGSPIRQPHHQYSHSHGGSPRHARSIDNNPYDYHPNPIGNRSNNSSLRGSTTQFYDHYSSQHPAPHPSSLPSSQHSYNTRRQYHPHPHRDFSPDYDGLRPSMRHHDESYYHKLPVNPEYNYCLT